jgi:hypothetical protein
MKALLTIATLVGAFLLAIGVINFGFNWTVCKIYGYQTEREVKYSGFVGCMIKTPAGWIPRNEIRTQLDQ